MKALYFDCFAGAGGDMIIGSLIDSGLEPGFLEAELQRLELSGYALSATKVARHGITGTAFSVNVHAPQPPRNYDDIIKLINSSSLEGEVKDNASAVFDLLARAESSVHGVDIEDVHFHEIGAVDSIIDICGAAIALKAAGSPAIHCSDINTGSGTVKTEHGLLPVPAPATALLLEGMTAYSSGTMAELTTPTAAAILKHYCGKCSAMPAMRISAAGYGAGSMELEFPNMLRVLHGETAGTVAAGDRIVELETAIDDMNPELFSHLFESLYSKGALDVTVVPAFMKKNRPGHILKVLTVPEKKDALTAEIFRETTSSGIRFRNVSRVILGRKNVEVNTEFGPVRLKVHEFQGETVTVSPEYEDCRAGALKHNVAVKRVYHAAVTCFYRGA